MVIALALLFGLSSPAMAGGRNNGCGTGGDDGRGGSQPTIVVPVDVHAGADAAADASAWQKQSLTSVQKTDVNVQQCNLPVVPLPQSASVGGGIGDYGTRITSAGALRGAIAHGWEMDRAGFDLTVEACSNMPGARSWKNTLKHITCSPVISHSFGPLAPTEKMHFQGGFGGVTIHPENIVGSLVLNTESGMKEPIASNVFKAYIYMVASPYGANRVFVLDEYEALQFRASSGLSFGSVLSAVTTGCATGGGISLGLGGAKKSEVRGNPGALVVLYRETAPQIAVAPAFNWDAQIAYYQEKVNGCKNFCLDNAEYRLHLADAYSSRGQIGDFQLALVNYAAAVRDVEKGVEKDGDRTARLPKGSAIKQAAEFNSLLAYRKLHGDIEASKKAVAYGFKVLPDGSYEFMKVQ